MARYSSSPDLVEDCRSISISNLKKWRFLEGYKIGSITWSIGGKSVSSIRVTSYLSDESPSIELDYTASDSSGTEEKFCYEILLERIPSNLGRGFRYYFYCPFTGVRCTKLHKPPGSKIFAHRTHWKSLYYKDQIEAKRWRSYSALLSTEEKLKQLCKPYWKPQYQGKQTSTYKRYLKLVDKNSKALRKVKADISH